MDLAYLNSNPQAVYRDGYSPGYSVCNGPTKYAFLLTFNSKYGSAPLQDRRLQNLSDLDLSRLLKVKRDGVT